MTNARLEELRTKFQENPRRYFAPFANELRKTGDVAQAIAICRTHLSGQPGHVSGHIVLGQALYEAGGTAEAREIFTAALDLDPENLIALRSMGEIAQVNGDFATARHWYERLLDADPRNSDVAQLLRDIPASAPATSPGSFAPPLQEVASEADAPATTTPEEAIPSPAGLHTTYTGAAPAYEPREHFLSPPSVAPVDELMDIDVPKAVQEPVSSTMESLATEPAVSEPVASEPLPGVIDMDSFLSGESPSAPALMPDEQVPEPAPESAAEMPWTPEATSTFELDALSPGEPPYAATATPDSEPEAEPSTFEPPRAQYAEHGFDGRADDQAGWITPSAAYSDLEAAPEDWFTDPQSAMAEGVTMESGEAGAAEAGAIESSAPSETGDSWFDDVESAGTEPALESTDEFWMPDFGAAVRGDVPEPSLESPMAGAAAAPLPDASGDTISLEASAAAVSDESQAARFDDELVVEDSEDAVLIQHPSMPDASAAAHQFPGGPVEVDPAEFTADATLSLPTPGPAPQSEVADAVASVEPVADLAEVADQAWAGEATAPEPVTAQSAEAETEAESEEAVASVSGEYPNPSVGHTPSFSAAIPATPAPAPFVTETLAELYLQQGFREEAAAIYRQLAERDPLDQSLRRRIEAIERGEPSDVMQAADTPADLRRGPSVRSFFSKLARRAPVAYASASPVPLESTSTHESSFASAASALANLFAASRPAPSDEGAASALASAFTDPAGRPSRAADRELSLDHLFRDVPPGGQGPDSSSVMLDEFYASSLPAQPGTPAPSGEATAAPVEPEGGSDIRQFTAWLEGLRKK